MALDLIEKVETQDASITLLKGGDHRMSTATDFALLSSTVELLIDSLTCSGGSETKTSI